MRGNEIFDRALAYVTQAHPNAVDNEKKFLTQAFIEGAIFATNNNWRTTSEPIDRYPVVLIHEIDGSAMIVFSDKTTIEGFWTHWMPIELP